jgi:UDP-N-acetylmuramate dehydrogenase
MSAFDYDDIIVCLEDIVKKERIKTNVPMKEHTTMRVGGMAKIMVLPESCNEIAGIKKLLTEKKVPHFIMGNGSNLVVADSGYSGVIIKLSDNFSGISAERDEITALAGTNIAAVSNAALKHSLSGLEFAAGIPGTTGGAATMNAGAYGHQMEDVITETYCIDENGESCVLAGKDHEFGYRTSIIQKNNLIVLKVKMKLVHGDQEEIRGKMNNYNCLRREKQPINLPSAGSVFKRPDGNYAGKLIQEAGLRGFKIGGAQVSEKHCGFIVNTGNATATDVINLIEYIKDKVFENSGIMLEQEVKILGG